MQGGGLWIVAAITRDDVQLRDGYVQCRLVGVLKMKKLHLAFAHVHVDQAVITSDAVLRVNDWVTDA